MAQAWTDSERKVLKQDPLHDVKEEIQHHSPRLRHVDLPEGEGPGEDDTQMDDVVKAHVPVAFADELKTDHSMSRPATDFEETEEEFMEDDPLHNVKQELEQHTPHLRHVDSPYSPGHYPPASPGGGDVVKSEVPPAFEEELKMDHSITRPATDFEETEVQFMEDDPLHNVKQELEQHSPHLRHVDSPYSPGHHPSASPRGGDVVKSEVPPAFEEELKNDHDIVTHHDEDSGVSGKEEGVDALSGENQNVRVVRDPTFVGLRRGGRPRFRISANVVNRPQRGALNQNPETTNMCFKDAADDEGGESNDANPAESSSPQNEESSATKPLVSRGVSARGTPHFRISAHHGMRPGGPLSRDLKSETASESTPLGGDGAGADLSAEMKPKGPGLPNSRAGLVSSSGLRRGGLARTGSGVPGGDQKGGGGGSLARTGSGVPGEQRLGGGLARTGSGVPGEQRLGGGLARTGSGVPGNSLARQGSGAFGGLARTGSGVPSSKGGNDLKDFSSFLDSADLSKEETQSEEKSGDQKSLLGKIGGKIGETWNQVNSYGSPGQEVEIPKDTEEVATGESVRSADALASKNLLDVERAVQ